MDYQKHYELLIEKYGSKSKPEGYSERHHIIPKCLGGSNALDNLVYLSAEAHYIAHQMLVKINPDHYGLSYAAIMMTVNTNRHKRSNNKLYAWLRVRFSENVSKARRGFKMSAEQKQKLSVFRKLFVGWKQSDETKLKISLAQTGDLNHMFGKTQSSESNLKRSLKLKGVLKSEETKLKMSSSQKGNKKGAGRKGSKHSEESKLKISFSMKCVHLNKLIESVFHV